VLLSNTTGSGNTATGVKALYSNTTGYQNTAAGDRALYSNTIGRYNTATGFNTLYANTTGTQNTATGDNALYANTTGNSNTAMGSFALHSNTTGTKNTATGYQALKNNTSGIQNIANGNSAGRYVSGGTTPNALSDNSVFIGFNTKSWASDSENEIVIGEGAEGIGDNTVVIGNNSITTTILKGDVGIGITAPTEKLHVDGNILVTGSFIPDYVFEKYYEGESVLNPNYEMPSLLEIERFTKAHKHLPGVPSAKEVEAKGGILINRATEINLEKIEELYLHTIEQQKKIDVLNTEIDVLKRQVAALLANQKESNNPSPEKYEAQQ
jgi:hypothetical protein